ncbi:MAG TPA: hypothetical protein VIJ87_21655, partial [Pyrinomonadaceae bacterium]
MKLTIFGPNLRDQSKGVFIVHAADCKDCKKLKHEEQYTGDFETRADAAELMYGDFVTGEAEGMTIE